MGFWVIKCLGNVYFSCVFTICVMYIFHVLFYGSVHFCKPFLFDMSIFVLIQLIKEVVKVRNMLNIINFPLVPSEDQLLVTSNCTERTNMHFPCTVLWNQAFL